MSNPPPTDGGDAPPLSGAQRRWLRAQAHPLRPVVQVGERGLNPAVVAAVTDALAAHELIKVRLARPEDKKAAARELAEASAATLCGVVGHTVILYRPHPDEPKLELPQRA